MTIVSQCTYVCLGKNFGKIWISIFYPYPSWRGVLRKLNLKKQGLRRTRKLRQCTNWKDNLRICELAKASNKKNWSVQLVRPAGSSSWSVQMVCPAGLSSWSVQLVCPAGPSSWSIQLVCPTGLPSKVHLLQSARVAKCTCCKVYVLQSACVAKCTCCKVHLFLHAIYGYK